MVTKHEFFKCRLVRRKRSREQWSRRETIEARVTKWNFDVEMDTGVREQGVHAKKLRTGAFWSEIGTTPGCPACETPGPGIASTEEAKRGVSADLDTRPQDRKEPN